MTMESVLYGQSISRYTEAVMHEVLWTEGDVVRKLRVVAGWKLKDLVKRSGVSLTMIHELEMGKTKEAKRSTLTKIAAAFGLTLRQFLDLVPPSIDHSLIREVRHAIDDLRRAVERLNLEDKAVRDITLRLEGMERVLDRLPQSAVGQAEQLGEQGSSARAKRG